MSFNSRTAVTQMSDEISNQPIKIPYYIKNEWIKSRKDGICRQCQGSRGPPKSVVFLSGWHCFWSHGDGRENTRTPLLSGQKELIKFLIWEDWLESRDMHVCGGDSAESASGLIRIWAHYNWDVCVQATWITGFCGRNSLCFYTEVVFVSAMTPSRTTSQHRLDCVRLYL